MKSIRRGVCVAFVTLGALDGLATAQSFGDATIVGCSTIDCPIGNTTSNNCQVVDKTFTAIGLARIPVNSSSSLSGLSWVKGVDAVTSGQSRVFDQSFYLGTPSNVTLDDVGACALFFTNSGDRIKFDGSNTAETEGTCAEAMSESCVTAMNNRAKKIDFDGLSVDAACAKLKKEFEDNLDSECKSFADSSGWGNITTKALSGSSAVDPITSKENSTSNCWPIFPRSDNLTLVESFNTTASFSIDDVEEYLYGVTPILTIFFPGNGSVLSGVDSQMTCMKSLGESVATESTKSDGSNDEDGGAGVLSPHVGLSLLGVGLLSVGLFL